jgi:cellulose synthase/poly-beta-1,6-N-acetylglucosamine synthase-like glycosyltransferase
MAASADVDVREVFAPVNLAALPPPPALPADAPRIAIVTPSYNHARFLDATIDSVLAQNYPKLHYHVQDGGSVDGSIELLRSRRSHQLAQRTGQRAIPRD